MRSALFLLVATLTLGSATTAGAISENGFPKCQQGRFRSCVCASAAPKGFQYRPSLRACNGRAAIILSGPFKDAYSVVVRDSENRDRWPLGGINGCSKFEVTELGLNKCSAFKVQKKIYPTKTEVIHCLGAKGSSKLFKKVVRATIKITDIPGANGEKNIFRQCLAGPTKSIN